MRPFLKCIACPLFDQIHFNLTAFPLWGNNRIPSKFNVEHNGKRNRSIDLQAFLKKRVLRVAEG